MTNHQLAARARQMRLASAAKWFIAPPVKPCAELNASLIARGRNARKRLDTFARV